MNHTHAGCALYALYGICSLNLNHVEATTADVVFISNVAAHKFLVPIAGCVEEKGTQFQTQIHIEAQEQDIGFPGLSEPICVKTSNNLVKSSKLRNQETISDQTMRPRLLGLETLAPSRSISHQGPPGKQQQG